MPEKYQTDVLVVGGGPAGSLAAAQAAKQGCNTLIVEEHKEAGFPDHCAGLIGLQGLKRLINPIPSEVIQNYVSKANLVSPNGKILSIVKKNSMVVVNRAKLDQKLLQQALKNGSRLLIETHITKLTKKKQQISGAEGRRRNTKEKLNIKAKVIINAEGVRSHLVSQAGLASLSRDWFLPALQYEFTTPVPEPETVYLCFGRAWAPGFFAWVIPVTDYHVRVGVGVKREYGPPKLYLDHFIKKNPISSLFKFSAPIRRFGGIVSAAGPIPKTFTNGLLVVGDAAGQTKATSGGGVNIGGYCGRLAGAVAAESIQIQDYSQKFLRKYQDMWKGEFGRELMLMSLFRKRIAGTISDELLEKGFEAAVNSNVEKKLSNLPNVDLHAFGFFKSVLNPRYFILGIKNTSEILKMLLGL